MNITTADAQALGIAGTTSEVATLNTVLALLVAKGAPVTEEAVADALATVERMNETALAILNESNEDPRREQLVRSIGLATYDAINAA